MKKLLALLLCLSLLTCACLTGCKKNQAEEPSETEPSTTPAPTAEELYDAAMERITSATNYEIKTTQDIEAEGTVVRQSLINRVDGQRMYVCTTNDAYPDAEFECWYVDGVCYFSMGGQKVKLEISLEEYKEMTLGGDTSAQTLLGVPESWLSEGTLTQAEDGYCVTFQVSGAQYTQLLGTAGLAGEITGDVEYAVFFDAEGQLQQFTVTFDMLVDETEVHCVSTSTITFDGVAVEQPADAFSYTAVE